MRRRQHRDPRRNAVKPEMEKLEIRWLLSRAVALAGTRRTRELLTGEVDRVGGVLGRTLAAEFVQWAAHHRDQVRSGIAAMEAFESRKLAQDNLGRWGRLRLLAQMESRGDHQFDALYQHLSARHERWAVHHPASGSIGIALTPSASAGDTGTAATTNTPATPTASGGQPPPKVIAGGSPDAGIPPIVPLDVWGWYGINGAPPTVNDATPPPGNPCCCCDPNAKVMESDASPITGEFFQDHQFVTYQSQGQDHGIDLQYTSLQADAQPIVTGSWQVNSDVGSGAFSSADISLIVNNVQQGNPIVISGLTNATYLLQLQAITTTGLATGIYADTVQITKNLISGGTAGDTFGGSLMVANGASSHYGAGWSIGGLQQLNVGTTGSTLMIATGSGAPEGFTSSDGVNYTGDPTDTSTLTYSSTSQTYTRVYRDGATITFNSGGQETADADRNGNTTHFAFVASGAAAGAVSTITDPVGLVTTLTYDGNGHLSTIKDPGNRVTSFTFDANGNLTQIKDPDGAVTGYGYNSGHQMTSETNPNSHTATVTYDSFGRMSSETLFDGTSKVQLSPAQEVGLLALGPERHGPPRHDFLRR